MQNQKNNITVKKPIILGSYAFPLSPAESRKHDIMTHKWSVLLRCPGGENPSYYIKKVLYDLDPTFNNPRRVKTAPPYEITEVGWGEFTLHVKIFFVDETVEPVKLNHFLRLNPSKHDLEETANACVVSESHEELIFIGPQEWFYEKLVSGGHLPPVDHALSPYFLTSHEEETKCVRLFQEFQGFVQAQNRSLELEVSQLAEEVAKFKAQCGALQGSSQ